MLLGVFVSLLTCAASAEAKDAGPPVDRGGWLSRVPALRTGDRRAFRFRMDVDGVEEKVVAHVSWAPPDRRCVILCDRVDGLPLMIAVDGRVWVYDLIGGQILRIRAEPQLLARVRNGVVQCRWGMRADFPDRESRTTIDVDLGGVVADAGRHAPEALKVSDRPPRAWFDGDAGERILEVREQDASPVSFLIRAGWPPRQATIEFDRFAYGEPAPAWHRPVNEGGWPEPLRLVAVADAEAQPPDVRERLATFRQVLNTGCLFLLRPALRNEDLQRAVEKKSPVKLDFDAIRNNDAKLRDAWRQLTQQQGFNVSAEAPQRQRTDSE
jgi:hypothetical protein